MMLRAARVFLAPLVLVFLVCTCGAFRNHGSVGSSLSRRVISPVNKDVKSQMTVFSKKVLEEPEIVSVKTTIDLSAKSEGKVAELSQDDDGNLWIWRLAVVACAALWGSNFVVIKALVGDGTDAAVNAACRFIIGTLALSPFLFKAKSKDELIQGFEVGVYIGIGYIFQALGLITTTANKSAFICSLQVVVVALAGCAANRRLDLKSALCTALGVAGVACLELLGGAVSFGIGDLYSLGMPVFFGLSYLLITKYSAAYADNDSKLAFSAAQLLPVSMMATGWACLDGGPHVPDFLGVFSSPQVAAALAYSGVISTGLAVILQTYAFKKVPTSEASVLVVTEPLWAALGAVAFLGERLAAKDFAGAALILSSCLVNEVPAERLAGFLGRGGGGAEGGGTAAAPPLEAEVVREEEGVGEKEKAQEVRR